MSRRGLLQRSTPTTSNVGTSLIPVVAKKKLKCGEMVGGAAAECTAVVCCCPFAVLDMLVLVLYKAPKGLCMKVIEKKRGRNKKKKQRESEAVVLESDGMKEEMGIERMHEVAGHMEEGGGDLDLEMYGKFYGNGFWRSDSQKSM